MTISANKYIRNILFHKTRFSFAFVSEKDYFLFTEERKAIKEISSSHSSKQFEKLQKYFVIKLQYLLWTHRWYLFVLEKRWVSADVIIHNNDLMSLTPTLPAFKWNHQHNDLLIEKEADEYVQRVKGQREAHFFKNFSALQCFQPALIKAASESTLHE